jgi:phage shock protein PspC (stress-responsive transcriptional regulator)
MKKTLSINIRGIVFNIDEDAYQKLNSYLSEIYRHYKNQPGADEIVSDIENRVVELFQERTSSHKQVITLIDVEEVIAILGRPSDFDRELEDDSPPRPQATTRRAKGPKRLYRDPVNRVIGGVCSGLGAYFNVDPVWFRLAFVLAVIFAGTGILLYLILWIVLPPARTVSERLEMRGDPIDIDNIEKAVRKEMHDVKEKFGDYAEQAKQSFRKKQT